MWGLGFFWSPAGKGEKGYYGATMKVSCLSGFREWWGSGPSQMHAACSLSWRCSLNLSVCIHISLSLYIIVLMPQPFDDQACTGEEEFSVRAKTFQLVAQLRVIISPLPPKVPLNSPRGGGGGA